MSPDHSCHKKVSSKNNPCYKTNELINQYHGVSALVVGGFCFEKADNSMRSLRDGFNCCCEVVVLLEFLMFYFEKKDLGLSREGCLYFRIFCGWDRCRLLLAIKPLSIAGGWASLLILIRGWVWKFLVL